MRCDLRNWEVSYADGSAAVLRLISRERSQLDTAAVLFVFKRGSVLGGFVGRQPGDPRLHPSLDLLQ